MPRPQIILVSGVNGSGKTTFTKTISATKKIAIIDPDKIAKDITGSFSNIDTEQVSAGRQALAIINRYIDLKRSFIVESTISGKIYLKYLKKAKEHGYDVVFIYVALSSADLSAERVSSRVRNGGHNIPMTDVIRRYPKSLGNLKAHAQLADEAYIYDNSEHYRLVAQYKKGVLCAPNEAPNWLLNYL